MRNVVDQVGPRIDLEKSFVVEAQHQIALRILQQSEVVFVGGELESGASFAEFEEAEPFFVEHLQNPVLVQNQLFDFGDVSFRVQLEHFLHLVDFPDFDVVLAVDAAVNFTCRGTPFPGPSSVA